MPESEDAVGELATAVENGDAAAVAQWFVERNVTLVETPQNSDDDSKAALTAELDDFAVLVAFSSDEHVAVFAGQMPEVLAADGKLPAFVVFGPSFLATLPDGFGVLLNPETDDCVVIAPDLMRQAKDIDSKRRIEPSASVQIDVSEDRLQHTPLQREVFDWLESRGFRPARWLPKPDVDAQLRPAEEIASRLMALAALFTWVSAPKDAVPAEQLSQFIQRSRLRRGLTDEEVAILTSPRAQARKDHLDNIGWRLENMWSLAWILGFEPEPAIEASQIDTAVSRPMMFEFLPSLDGSLADLLSKSRIRPREEVIALEYRFYCAHNAVRSAQLGENTVPEGFHPVLHGGAVHERRHALSWSLSPGVTWDETDLST
jgi:hypothetical protein